MFRTALLIATIAILACTGLHLVRGVPAYASLLVVAAALLGLATYPKDYTATGQLLGRRLRVDPWGEDHRESMFAAKLLGLSGLSVLAAAIVAGLLAALV